MRTNSRFTLRERPLCCADLDGFVAAWGGRDRQRVESERFRRFAYEDLLKRDKLNLDLFWLKDANATDADGLPPPDEIAADIVDSLEVTLERFQLVAAKLAPQG